MAQINPGYTRRTELACSLEEMATYGAIVLYENEVIYVRQPDGTVAIKIGDGRTPLADLPYSVNYSDIKSMKEAAEAARQLIDEAREASEAAAERAAEAAGSLDIGLSVVDGKLNITFEEDI